MVFSNTVDNNGILQQTRDLCRVDSNQWATQKVVNSANNYLDLVAGYAIATDNRFQWDDTNHTKLPIGTTNLVANQSDYSFLTDEQGNKIITLTRIDIKDSNGDWTKLEELDETEEVKALDDVVVSGTPTGYYKISDNIIRLNRIPTANITAGLKFYFQRTPSYFDASSTTKEPGVSPLLHRGFVIASAYDCAITLGLPNTQALSVEMQKETQKMIQYLSSRNKDIPSRMTPRIESCR
jgi:hypothetical protein